MTPDKETIKKQSRLSIHMMASSEDETAILVEDEGDFLPLIEDKTSIISLIGNSVYLSPRVCTRNDEYVNRVKHELKECLGL